jgi:aspartyl protease family protein
VRPIAFLLCAAFAGGASAQSVGLHGTIGKKALLIVEGSEPKLVAPGETFRGVKVLSTSGDTATLEIAGRQITMRVGDSPVSVGARTVAPGTGNRIVLSGSTNGHFLAAGQINGQAVHFMVDTGASSIAMSEADAKRLNIAFADAPAGQSRTANGTVKTHIVSLDSVRVGDVEVRNVEAAILPSEMPFILLGNSFLSRFSIRKDADQMVLERRY